MNLLIYDNKYEPVTAALIKNKIKYNLDVIWLKEFIEKVEIFDEFDRKETKIRWWLPDNKEVNNSEDTFIINRIFNLPKEWFIDFYYKDREYAKSEFWAYLVFALNAFKNITEKPNLGGFHAGCYALTSQWKHVCNKFKDLATPDFYIGSYDFIPKSWLPRAIFTNPYNFYFWKKNNFEKEKKENLFVIKKPLGIPILTFNNGKEVNIYNESGCKIKKEIEVSLQSISRKIHNSFNYFMSESLFFLDKEEITFGMIHNSPIASAYMLDFEAQVNDRMESLFNNEISKK